MGIHDREYYRDQLEHEDSGSSWSAVGAIIALNVLAYFASHLLGREFQERWMSLPADIFAPGNALALITEGRIVTLLTYGFAHSHDFVWHIVFNMLALWMFGGDIERIYGKRLFWQMYLSFIVISGLLWVAAENFLLRQYWVVRNGELIVPAAVGASGAVAGVLLLFVLHFPRQTILFMAIIPMPAWVFGIIWLATEYSLFELHHHGQRITQVAHAAHLGGALAGWLFYRTHFTLFSLLPTHWIPRLLGRASRPQIRVFRPDDNAPIVAEESLDAEVDRLLAKISQHGTESLTPSEVRTLEAASRRAQRRRGGARRD